MKTKSPSKTKILKSVAISLLLYPSLATAAAFVNGSFEDSTTGTATGWTVTHGPGGVNDLTFGGQGATDGTKCAAFNPFQLTGAGILSQTFDTLTGQTYFVSFDFGSYGNLNGYSQQILVEVRNGALFNSGTQLINLGTANIIVGANAGASLSQSGSQITVFDITGTNNVSSFQPVPTSPQFSAASFTFTAQSASSTLVFSDKTAGTGQFTDANIDNVRIVPEPSSAALLLLGALTIARRHRP